MHVGNAAKSGFASSDAAMSDAVGTAGNATLGWRPRVTLLPTTTARTKERIVRVIECLRGEPSGVRITVAALRRIDGERPLVFAASFCADELAGRGDEPDDAAERGAGGDGEKTLRRRPEGMSGEEASGWWIFAITLPIEPCAVSRAPARRP